MIWAAKQIDVFIHVNERGTEMLLTILLKNNKKNTFQIKDYHVPFLKLFIMKHLANDIIQL